jgi:drug/metabolite transporter (DMT)-like permease
VEDKKTDFMQKTPVVWAGALICCLLWGSAFPCVKIGYRLFAVAADDSAAQILFAGLRFTLAGVLAILIGSVLSRKVLLPKKEAAGGIVILCLLQTVIQYFFFYIGLANTSGAKGTIISGSSSFFAIFFSSLLFKQEKLTVKKIIACIVGFAGIIAVNLNGLDFSMNFTGDAFVLFSAMSLAVSSVLIKIFSKDEDPVVISGYQFMLGGAVMVIVGLIAGGKIDYVTPKGIAILVYLSFLSAIAYALWGVLLKFNPVSKVTIYSFMIPVFGVLLSNLLLSEQSHVSPINLIITLILVSTGIIMLNYKKE